MIIVKTRPLESKFDNFATLFNEITVSIYLYVIMVLNLFQQGKYPPSYRNMCGIILISVVIVSVAVNFLVFFI